MMVVSVVYRKPTMGKILIHFTTKSTLLFTHMDNQYRVTDLKAASAWLSSISSFETSASKKGFQLRSHVLTCKSGTITLTTL